LIARGRKAVMINADSAQLYADLPSSPPRRRRRMRLVPHRLLARGMVPHPAPPPIGPGRARRNRQAHAAGQVPILVGGTGLYIRTLLDGIAPVPAIDPDVREAVRALPVDLAHAALTRRPRTRRPLHPADTTRVARALEVVRSTGHPGPLAGAEGGHRTASPSIPWSCCPIATGSMNAATAALP
jgi:tRNA dimethylallyltransferase